MYTLIPSLVKKFLCFLYYNDKFIGEIYLPKEEVEKIVHILNTHPLTD